jgi:hypothetical protein
MNRLFLFFILFFTILTANSVHCTTDSFEITIKRDILNHNTLKGRIFVNGEEIGKTWERYDLRIAPGHYPGNIRYFSDNENAVGPFRDMGFIGDFLLEIGEVTWGDGKKRTNLLFHGGNNWKHSRGCIMLGAVQNVKLGYRDVKIPLSGDGFKMNKYRYIPEDHTLWKLRELFYGKDLTRKLNGKEIPFLRPVKKISITIEPFNPRIIGKYQSWGNAPYNFYLEISIDKKSLSGEAKFYFMPDFVKVKDIEMISGESIKFKLHDNNYLASRSGNTLRLSGVGGRFIESLEHTSKFKYAKLLRETRKCYKATSCINSNFKQEYEIACENSQNCVRTTREYSDGNIESGWLLIYY